MTTAAFQAACDELRALGLLLRQSPGEYRVNFPHGTAATAYVTDDLQDALKRGREMAENPLPAPDAPLGPMGRRTRRGDMYRHNRMVAATRRRKRRRAGS
jgi:hypothetical protein